MESKNYTVMELAEQIGVPRTTINDWLARYSMYIDTVAQGKRKVYPETALAVLREVASLRNAGKAFSEIETELAAKHPIQAVPLPPQEEIKPEKNEAAKSSSDGASVKPESGAGEATALVSRQQSEEIGRLIGESFRNMDQRIHELENLSSAQRKMSYLWQFICLLFLLCLAVGGYLAMRLMNQAKQENRRLQDRQVKTSAQLTALKVQSVALIAGNKEFQANISRLKTELKQQKKDFEQNIRTEKQRLTELHQAKEKALLSEREKAMLKVREQETLLALEKEKFAAERLKILNEMDKLKKQNEELKNSIKNMNSEKKPEAASPVPAQTVEPVKKASDKDKAESKPEKTGK